MYCGNCGHTIKKSDQFCEKCGTKNKAQSAKEHGPLDAQVPKFVTQHPTVHTNRPPKLGLILGVLALLAILSLVGYIAYQNNLNKRQASKNASDSNLQQLEKDAVEAQKLSNLKAVVNIVCDNGNGGSGTIISKDGLVLTNEHVVSSSGNCLVSLPDTNSGNPIAIYESKPILSNLSEAYDIALLNITASFTDENGKTWGSYPIEFPSYIRPDICDQTKRELGNPIKVYGYPVTSGGSNLTVTDGIISSFADEGYILTTAKIDNGNSGGFAVDSNGCFVGIPSAVIKGNYQTLGVIISPQMIDDFINEIPKSSTDNKTFEDISPIPEDDPLDLFSDNNPGTKEHNLTTPTEATSIKEFKTIAYVEWVSDPITTYLCSGIYTKDASEQQSNVYISAGFLEKANNLRNSVYPGSAQYKSYHEAYIGSVNSYNISVLTFNDFLKHNCTRI